ncbi:putative membrane protein YccC [Ancylobacter sp. 3268]|uniref:FUSC family protein n=1 Tax=Ancylobacter sp. 3268 TaxID=2817752 RepID=UPI00285EC637|nr:FUSC family protein [Ancylobacter sp. 3268]MDR6955537.1 putative membrane protein YccC [Ancylobacter sp. 3268]
MNADVIRQPGSFAGFGLSSWMFACRVWLALVLALYASFWLELEAPSSAALTVAILSLPTRGQGLEKAGFRLIATTLGIIATFVITGVFTQSGLLLLIAFALWIGACVYAAGMFDGNRAYAASLGAVTVSFIALQNIDTPQNVFDAATARGAAIVIGILALAFVNDLLGAPDFHPKIARQLRELHARVRAYSRSACGNGTAADEEALHLLRDIAALRPDVASLGAESSNGRARRSAAQAAMVNLVSLLAAARGLQRLPRLGNVEAVTLRKDTARSDLQTPRVSGCEPTALVPEGTSELAALTCRLAHERLLIADRACSDDLGALRQTRFPQHNLRAPMYASRRLAFENGVAGALSFGVAALALRVLDWPAAEICLAFVGILIGLSATAPDRRAFATVALIAAPMGCLLAGLLEFVVLDGATGFPQLALGMAPFVIGLGLLMTKASPVIATLARTNLIFMIAVFAPSNPQSYDPQEFVFACTFVCVAALLLFAIQYLIPSRTKPQKLAQLLYEADRDIRRHRTGPTLVPARELNVRELGFRDAVRVGQIVDLAEATSEGRDAMTWSLHRFDEVSALRICDQCLDRFVETGSAALLQEARCALKHPDAVSLLAVAQALNINNMLRDPALQRLAAAFVDASLTFSINDVRAQAATKGEP